MKLIIHKKFHLFHQLNLCKLKGKLIVSSIITNLNQVPSVEVKKGDESLLIICY